MSKKFTASVDSFISAYKERMRAIVLQSTQDVINEASTAKAKGGKMPVKTGFLRASGQISFTGLPTGPVRGEKTEPGSYEEPGADVYITQLATFQVGMTIYFGWTANYARVQELYNGFMATAASNWVKYVDANVERLKAQINGN